MTAQDWLAVSLVLVGLLLVVGAVHLYTLRHSYQPEVPRKTIHVTLGLICCFFP